MLLGGTNQHLRDVSNHFTTETFKYVLRTNFPQNSEVGQEELLRP